MKRWLLLWVCAACATPDPGPYLAEAQRRRSVGNAPPAVPTPGVERDRFEGGAVSREVLRLPDGRVLRHGMERSFYADGARRAEREFDRDQPTGEWRSWYPDGTLRSEYTHGDSPSPMIFYHENGTVSARGDAVDGRRVGHWRFYDAAGGLQKERDYS